MLLLPVVLSLLSATFAVGIAVQDLPQCAQGCLSNSTSAQTQCTVVELACLCTSNTYVSTLSCCLAQSCNTAEQAVAIQFNQQECASVNQTAPDFVGCSPLEVTSSAIVHGAATTYTSVYVSASSTTTANTLVSTITGSPVDEPASLNGAKASTATFNGAPLLTGSCTVPIFAMITGDAGSVFEYPEVGCNAVRRDCCPYDSEEKALITKCPQDYFTTASGCCPLGYQVYFTNIGPTTPCYSTPSITFVPATTPTESGFTLITDAVFAHMYELTPPSHGKTLPLGGLIGIILNVVLFVGIIILLIWCVRRRKARARLAAERATTFPPEEPALSPYGSQAFSRRTTQNVQTPQELASPEMQQSSGSRWRNWPLAAPLGLFNSPPPAYNAGRAQEQKKAMPPSELPGSTFIHEHHPAFTGEEASSTSPPKSPVTPTRAPVREETWSRMGPGSPSANTTSTNGAVSPIGSPRMTEHIHGI